MVDGEGVVENITRLYSTQERYSGSNGKKPTGGSTQLAILYIITVNIQKLSPIILYTTCLG